MVFGRVDEFQHVSKVCDVSGTTDGSCMSIVAHVSCSHISHTCWISLILVACSSLLQELESALCPMVFGRVDDLQHSFKVDAML